MDIMKLRYITFKSYELVTMGMLNTYSIRRDEENEIYYQKYGHRDYINKNDMTEQWTNNYISHLNEMTS